MDTDRRDIDPVDDDFASRRINLRLISNRMRLKFEGPLTKRKILIARVDFPLPVRPNMPTRSPAFKVKDTSRRTGGNSGAYLIVKFLTSMSDWLLALEGQ